MKDGEANIALIRHVTRRLDEFFYENDPTEFNSVEEARRGFARWLRQKDSPRNQIKEGDGMYALQLGADEVVDDQSHTLAFLKVMNNGHVGLMWSPILFAEGMVMPDELRDLLIATLRFHADKLEDRSLDTRMRQCAGKMMGTA